MEKQIKAIEDNKKQAANNNEDDYRNELLVSKKKEKYLKIFIMKDKINKINKKWIK